METVIREKGQEIRPEGRLGHGKIDADLFARGSGIVLFGWRFFLLDLGGQTLGNRKGVGCQLVQLL